MDRRPFRQPRFCRWTIVACTVVTCCLLDRAPAWGAGGELQPWGDASSPVLPEAPGEWELLPHAEPVGDSLEAWSPPPLESYPSEIERHLSWGEPLVGTSWRNRPLHVGWLFGGYLGEDLSGGAVQQHGDIFGGYRLGWDYDHYWGTEARFAFTNVDISDPGVSHPTRNAKQRYWDLNLAHYPWGDTRWRPFASAGLGVGVLEYTLPNGFQVDEQVLTVPLAAGVKYYFRNWMALRFTATDNWAIGHGPVETMHNWSLTADVEMRFGGRRRSYFPYSGSMHLW